METYSVYALVDPRSDKVRYVGMSKSPHTRYLFHLRMNGTNERKNRWIASLKAKLLKPELRILHANLTQDEASRAEATEIANHKNLFNIASGGLKGFKVPKSTCVKRAKSNAYRARKVVCLNNGKTYSSIRQASKALRIPVSAVSEAAEGILPSYKGFKFEFAEGANEAPTPGTRLPCPIVCNETGITFASISEASREMNINIGQLSMHLNHPDEYHQVKGFHFKLAEVPPVLLKERATGLTFLTIRQAAKHFGLHPSTISAFLHGRLSSVKGHHFEWVSLN